MEDTENIISNLKSRGLTCSRLKSMANKQMIDAKRDRKDSSVLRNFGFSKQADYQEQIAKAQEKSAEALKALRKRLCPLK